MAQADIIRDRYERLIEKRLQLVNQLKHIDRQLHDTDVQISLLQELYEELIDAEEADDEDSPQEPQPLLPGPSDAVRQLLEDHPDGLPQPDIVRLLMGRIDTTSRDEKRVITNTIINLRNRGELERDEFGVVRLSQENGVAATPF